MSIEIIKYQIRCPACNALVRGAILKDKTVRHYNLICPRCFTPLKEQIMNLCMNPGEGTGIQRDME